MNIPQKTPLWISILLMLIGAVVGWHIGGCARSAQAAPLAEAQPTPDTMTLSRTYVERTAPNKPPAAKLPTDPFQRTATRALRGDFGPLQPWQADGYRRGLKQGVTASTLAWCTCYYHTEASGHGTRYAGHASTRTVAANRLRAGTWVWHERGGIRQVQDTGAHSNDRHADRRGCDLWLDWWYPTPGDAAFDTHVGNVAVIREGE